MTVSASNEDMKNEFPVGMKVLAVDDNPTCLMVLESLLRKCRYEVTTLNQAVTALELLRQNKDKFDLVISDVDMPGMDGFRLLEYVGLEMDLPVIMLSSHGDKELVMKGITHGACDYLLKPVRIEELKNIWQHVVRRKKLDPKEGKTSDKSHGQSGEAQEEFRATENADHNGKRNRKRKDQNNEEAEEYEEKGQQYQDSSTQKKPRVVWTPDLHRKFVAAVNQLGLDKAVPKRILELMNDDKLTRENVASHLQKYRLYLKKYNGVEIQQPNMVAAFGSADCAYERILNGVTKQHVDSAGKCTNAGYRSYPAASVPNRLNTPAALGWCGLSSSGIIQQGQAYNLMNTINHEPDIHSSVQTGNHSLNMLNGMPMLLEFDNGQCNKDTTSKAEFCSANYASLANTVSSDFSELNVNGARTCAFANNMLILEEHLAPRGEVFGNRSSTAAASLSLDFSSNLPNFGRCNDNWTTAGQSLSFFHEQAPSSDLTDNMPTSGAHVMIYPLEVSSLNSGVNTLSDVKTDWQCQAYPVNHNAVHNMNHSTIIGGNILHQEFSHKSNQTLCPRNSLVVPREINDLSCQRSEFHVNDEVFNLVRENNLDDPFATQLDNAELTAMALKLETTAKNYSCNSVSSLEDIVDIMKRVDGSVQVDVAGEASALLHQK